MFKEIRKWLHKKIYKLLIYRTIVLDRHSVAHYDRLETFCSIDMQTDKGIFKFLFKKDRRKKTRYQETVPSINNYVIELVVPDGLIPYDEAIKNKLVVVVKVMLFKVDYEILTELLADLYLDQILKYINQRSIEQ